MTEETNQLTDMNSECGSSEPYALQVTDNSMEPEFPKDCIVIVDPSGSCNDGQYIFCLLYTSPSPRDKRQSRMPSSA